ncbi:MAG: sigma-70 family RNA polymerase sigma factor [Chitinophagaceae bacterium]|nr:sigma-70 family RNA polymerase sigma factor [Chitinophagaceae bacterium]
MLPIKLNTDTLIQQYCDGNEKAFDTISNLYSGKVYSTAYSILKNKKQAEDIVQEVFIKVFITLKKNNYSDKGKFEAWILKITRNMSIDHLRKHKKKVQYSLEQYSSVLESIYFVENAMVEHNIIEDETKKYLWDLIHELPKNQREIIIMKHYLNMSFKEISTLANISINTALGIMRYGIINLRKKINEEQIHFTNFK